MQTTVILKQQNFRVSCAMAALLVVLAAAFTGCAATQDTPTDSASQLYYHGLRLFNKGKYEEAKEIFRQYIADNAGTHLYPVSLYYLGCCYQKLGDQAQARLIYHKVIDESQDDFWTQMAKTRIAEMGGEK